MWATIGRAGCGRAWWPSRGGRSSPAHRRQSEESEWTRRFPRFSAGVQATAWKGGSMGRQQQPLEHRLLLTATFCLLAGGAVMVYSASSARTLLEGEGDGTAYLVKYVMYGALGLVVMHALARTPLERVRQITPLLLLVAFVLLVAVLIPH